MTMTSSACLFLFSLAASTIICNSSLSCLRSLSFTLSFPVWRYQIPRGGAYAWCNGTSPTAANPCEPGVFAFNPNLAASAQNVTGSVVVCPHASCLSGNGCSPQVSQTRWWSRWSLIVKQSPQFSICYIDLWIVVILCLLLYLLHGVAVSVLQSQSYGHVCSSKLKDWCLVITSNISGAECYDPSSVWAEWLWVEYAGSCRHQLHNQLLGVDCYSTSSTILSQ
jgi:hypothetical protein